MTDLDRAFDSSAKSASDSFLYYRARPYFHIPNAALTTKEEAMHYAKHEDCAVPQDVDPFMQGANPFTQGSEAQVQYGVLLEHLSRVENLLAQVEIATTHVRKTQLEGSAGACNGQKDSSVPPSSTVIGGVLGSTALRLEVMRYKLAEMVGQIEAAI